MTRRRSVFPLDVTQPGVVEVRTVRPKSPEAASRHAETLLRLRSRASKRGAA